jgi:argininosuccinate lyase
MSAKLWAGRFSADITADVLDYTLTVDIDTRLIPHDLWQSIAHCLMLADAGIIASGDAAAVLRALLELARENSEGRLELRPQLEDVHLNLETMVIERAGPQAGGRMHTARSRNDQVATDTRMYLRAAILELAAETCAFVRELGDAATGEIEHVIPGYTHSQPAQPISVAFWRLGHGFALLRDLGRLRDACDRLNECPLGSGALAGTSFPIDRDVTAQLLGFDRPMASALDATSARDFVQEVAAVLAVLATHVSRLAEEVVVWSGHEYALVTVPDSFATGSSIMPQKKNPVVAELARARTGRVYGTVLQLLVMAKGIGLGYSCDLQEDKPLIWDALDVVTSTVRLMRQQTNSMTVHHERGTEICYENFSTATELANYLVSEHDLPFRDAHRIVGETVAELIARRCTLRQSAVVAELLGRHGVTAAADVIAEVVAPQAAIRRSISAGGTGSDATRQAIQALRAELAQVQAWRARTEELIEKARERTFAIAADRVLAWDNEVAGGSE